MSRPLEGVRVVDFGHYFAAPMAAGLLADQGADVVRVLRPGRPELPAAQMRWLNRNKRVIELDLGTQDGQRRARSLATRSDVVVSSFRPGVMERWGLGYEALQRLRPDLIHLSLPGFASTDEERAGLQAWEGVVAAAASLLTSGLRKRLGFPPQHIPVPACSAFGAAHGAIAVVSALLAKTRSGRGTRIEVPLIYAGLSTCTRSFVYDGGRLRAETNPNDPLPEFLAALEAKEGDSLEARRTREQKLADLAPPIYTTRQYESADGRFLLIMPIKPGMARRFFEILGLMPGLADEGFVVESPWRPFAEQSEKNLASSWTLSRNDSLRLIELIEDAIARESASHWERTLGEAGIPIGIRRTRREWLSDPELLDAGLLSEMTDGRTHLLGAGRFVDLTTVSGGRPRFVPNEPITIEREEIDSVFPAHAQTESEVAPADPQPIDQKSELLSGLRVLDLCNVVAGPNAAYTLAQLGADIVRVEPPESFNLPMHHEWTLEVNQGKRSIVLDTRSDAGRDAFERLVRNADLIVHNRLDSVANRLGMSAGDLQAINPNAVVCQISAYGGDQPSFWDEIPGYDPMPNLASGLDVLAGTPENPRAMVEIFGDLMSGLGASFAGVLGLFVREREGYSPVGRASLARAAHFYQLPYLLMHDGSCDWDQGRGPEARGDGPWQRMFATADGWIYVGARDDRARALARLVAGDEAATEDALEAAFREMTTQDWLKQLREADFGCHPVLSIDDLCAPETLRDVDNEARDESAPGALEVLRWPDHPSGLPVVLPSPAWVQIGSRHTIRRLAPVPIVGAHTREVLAELGYADSEIDALYENGVAHDFLPAIGNAEDYFYRPKSEES